MSLKPVSDRLRDAPAYQSARTWAQTHSAEGNTARSVSLKGFVASLPAFLLADLEADLQRPILCVTATPESAAYLVSDLEQISAGTAQHVTFPPTGHTPYDHEQVQDAAPLITRADTLQRLVEGYDGIIVTSIDALVERVPPASAVKTETFPLAVGDEISPGDLVEMLKSQGFTRVEFVGEPGELALRGGILDVYPFAGDYPFRLEFFGDEIDAIREFEVTSQRSVSRLTNVRIVPNLERDAAAEGTSFTPLFDYLPEGTLVALFDDVRLQERAAELYGDARARYDALDPSAKAPLPDQRYVDPTLLDAALAFHPRLLLGSFTSGDAEETITLDARPQPNFNKQLRLVRAHVQDRANKGEETYILCDSRGQEARLLELLEEEVEAQQVRLLVESLHEGFDVPSLGLAVYTDHEIFGRYHRPSNRQRVKRTGGLSLRDLKALTPGDFVVHTDYGIGKFGGMRKVEVRGKKQESVRVEYAGGDTLFVNVSALYKLHKFSGKEGHQPKLTKLGSGQWERTKARTKARVKDIARDLIRLYAERKNSQGHAFAPDSIWQRELEASFAFEDTPDQASAAEAVKEDMEQSIPMDRLVCGDVGFGKTEVAVRAAFKAVQDGKQVAILVPTTILASQHFETFSKRLANYPVKVGVLSRFVPTKEQKEVIAGAKSGELDILIGTHRIVSKDVGFKDLGLLIVDEEQRFGVGVKEKLRKLRAEVDTLTLTATPIPRTLQFSLLGARDLSIIGTAPPNRQPIVTEIHTFDKNLVRDAILYETSRGGQVFFIHNRVKSIDEIGAMVQALVPGIRLRVAHGQMKPTELEDVMEGFLEKKFDVLVSTNIIESGLDIGNANTIIINNAQRHGLSELHQLRGRVGRSDRRAFCYLLVPSVHALTREAKARLRAVEEFADLGSGFNIAMRDLDIRGAGSLLGAEQSGFMGEVGYETYHQILDEAVQEIRQEEFKEMFKDAPAPKVSDTVVDVEEDALLPESYVTNHLERLGLYRRISDAADGEALQEIREELVDRFGPVPVEVEHLLLAAELRHLGEALRLPKIVFKNKRLFLEVPKQDADPYFYETHFKPLLERLNDLGRRYVLKETASSKKLRAIIQDVPDLAVARATMQRLTETEEVTEA